VPRFPNQVRLWCIESKERGRIRLDQMNSLVVTIDVVGDVNGKSRIRHEY
jgi:hypothetical protein